MNKAFKINIPLAFSQEFSPYRPGYCTPALRTGTGEKHKRGDSLRSWHVHSCLGKPGGLSRLRAALFSTQMKMLLEAGQETSCTSPNHRWHACLHPRVHQRLKSGRRHLGEPTMSLPKQKLRVVHGQKAGRVSGCHPTKGACTHDSPYRWQDSRTCKIRATKPKTHVRAEQATNFPPWWKHNEENLSDRFTAGSSLQPKHI